MNPPFTVEQFLGVFGQYNQAVWPVQIAFVAAAVLAVAFAAGESPGAGRWIGGLLAFFWAWMGAVYHWAFFTRINPAAWLFGALFVVQALLFAAVLRRGLGFRARGDAYGVAGAVMVAYALVLYPLAGLAAGRVYPEAPTFGLPCPTTIFTFGLLLWADRRVPPWLVAIPALWSLLGAFAAVSLGITEDYGLLVAGVAGTAAVLAKNHRLRVHPASGAPAPAAL